jgi:hypothetical protein
MPNVLWCRHCLNWWTGSDLVPTSCPTCKSEASWTTDPPQRVYVLGEWDRKLLRALKIAAS